MLRGDAIFGEVAVSMKYSSLILIAVCSAVFATQILHPPFTDEFILNSNYAAAKPWTLITAIFLHADYLHLFYNMLALAMFGLVLENIIGSRKFLVVFFAAGLAANIVSIFFYDNVLGASGAIFGVIGTLVVIRPRMIAFALGVPMPMIAAAALWALLDLGGVFYPTNIANAAHLAGLVAGITFGICYRKDYPEKKEKTKRPLSEKDIKEWEEKHMTG